MPRWFYIPILIIAFSIPVHSQGGCTGLAVAPSSDYEFAVATSDEGGTYRWTLDGQPIASGKTSQALLLHADGSLMSSSGIQPLEQRNVSFGNGRWRFALAVEKEGLLSYPRTVLSLDEGTIEMWIALRMDGGDAFYCSRDQVLFHYRAQSWDQMRIGISAVGGGFYAGINRGLTFKGVGAPDFRSWKAGEWHHIAFTYSSGQARMRFYLDGRLKSENQGDFVAPSSAGDRFSIGSTLFGEGAYVLIDEVRLSSKERLPQEILASATRTRPIGSNEVLLSIQEVRPGKIGYELTTAGVSAPCLPVSWDHSGIPLTDAVPSSNLLPAGTEEVLFSVRSAVPASCRYSIGEALEYMQMTPFDEGQGGTRHRTRLRLSADPRRLNRVFVRSSSAPGYLLEMKWRSVAAANPPFPRKGAIWIHSDMLRANFEEASRISLFYGVWFEPQDIQKLRAVNPEVLIFPSVSADEIGEDTARVFGLPADFYLRDVNGKRIEGSWSRLYKLNLTKPEVADYLAEMAYRLNRDADFAFDGIFFDNFHTSVSYQSHSDAYGNPVKIDANGDGEEDDPAWLDAAWREGVFRLLSRFRSLMPNALIAGHLSENTSAEPEVRASINGVSIVAASTDVAEGRRQFFDLWSRYHGWLTDACKPALMLIEGAPHYQLAYGYGIWDASANIPPPTLEFARSFYPLMRFGLALTLMGDGYFVFNYGDVATLMTDLKAIWWYDEFDFDLGYPTGPARLLDTALGNNMIRNGGFERSWREGWSFYIDPTEGARATVESSGAAGKNGSVAHIIVSAAAKPHHVQFWQPGLSLEKGKTYTVHLRAKADRARTIDLAVLKDTPDYRNYGLDRVVNITSNWQEHAISFQSDVTARDARLGFYLGENVGEVWLDDIVLQTGGLVYRRDFTKGTVLLNASSKPAQVNLETGFARFFGEQAPRYQYIIDDGAEGFTAMGNWRRAAVDGGLHPVWGPMPNGPYYHAWNGSCHISDTGRGSAQWPLNIAEDGKYTIQVWWADSPDASRWCSRAVYEVVSSGRVIASAALDERTGGDQWHTISTVWLSATGDSAIRVRSEGEGALVADALHIFSSERLNDGIPVRTLTIPAKDGILLRRLR